MMDRRVWFGLLVSGLFLYLALRNVQWQEVWTAWQAARLPLFLLGLCLLIVMWVVSAMRWRVLLSPAPGLRVRDTFAYIAIGYFANTVLPLRLGELARATLIGRKKGLGIPRALGSIALERVLDLMTLIGVTLATAQVIDLPPAIRSAVKVLSVAGLCALGGMAFLAFHQERLSRLTFLLEKFLPRGLIEKGMALIQSFATGATVLRRPAGFLAVLGLSAVFWVGAGMVTLAWIRAFQLPVPWYGAYFVLIMINFGSAIPSSPGYIGVYHYLAVLALSPWVPDRSSALAYAIGTHAAIMVANLAVGGFCLSREGIGLRSLREAEAPPGAEGQTAP